jgi:aminoglycoside 6'-N-acetyltransferase I
MHTIRLAFEEDRNQLVSLRMLLWPDSSSEEELQQIQTILSTNLSGTLPAAILVAEEKNGALVGFLEVGLRSHADGCDTARPVGFVEGWFVVSSSRGRGIGRDLMRAAEDWARKQGCIEMASDSWITHEDSHRAHQALGFEVVDRCVHFRKAL